jgi:hypothetical protein
MIFSYPDTLFDKWVEWSEGFLSSQLQLSSSDLNTILGSTGADNPSRAVEFYNIGFLEFPLTNSSVAYDNLRNNIPVHSDLGYLAYLISKAKTIELDNEKINFAFKAICSICLLQQYEEFENGKISLNTILQYLMELFPRPHNCDEMAYLRYLSAAMYCELHSNRENIFRTIKNGNNITLRIIDRKTNISRADFNNSSDIQSAIVNRVSLTSIVYEKGSIFFIGNQREDNPRGLFYSSFSNFQEFLKDCYEVEIQELENNPFSNLFNTQPNYNIIKSINEILLKKRKNLNYLKVMKTLQEGCLEAIKILNWADKHGESNNSGLNKIYYGAPGTGKSHCIKEYTTSDNSIRKTFHPDTDYSSFVGSYKPIEKEDRSGITYGFVPQAFLLAYLKAWETLDNTYLIIEEINRGNCAQIFGDIFQLIDRKSDGYSSFPIDVDTDLSNFLKLHFETLLAKGGEYSEKAQRYIDYFGGSYNKMALPNNLFIHATMNTSDQSLFPVDSAFKRRWEWEYVPIEFENTEANGYLIKVESDNFGWRKFIEAVNEKIKLVTNSEDKKLGQYFVKSFDNYITENTFKSKVMFYIWNDILKDEPDTDERYFFRQKINEDDNSGKPFTFSDLFSSESSTILKNFMAYLDINAG